MKFTLAWLKEHLDTDATLDQIVDRLTMIGLEVEHVVDQGKSLAPYVIARVVEAKQHPNADRLRVCMVDTGAGDPVQVVCGAPNARTGMKGVFVPPGAFIPGKNMTLQVGTIRGVESRGMLVSEFELQISDDHEGIIDLPADAPVGASFAQYAGLDDPVIDINLTTNRPDCRPDSLALPGVRFAPRARRQERAFAGLAAKAAHGDRAASDQRAGRHHQFHHLRPRPAAARVRRRQGQGQPGGPPRPQRRAVAGARRQELHAR
jgi:tRNA-binding EMAP/Myf-like protein